MVMKKFITLLILVLGIGTMFGYGQEQVEEKQYRLKWIEDELPEIGFIFPSPWVYFDEAFFYIKSIDGIFHVDVVVDEEQVKSSKLIDLPETSLRENGEIFYFEVYPFDDVFYDGSCYIYDGESFEEVNNLVSYLRMLSDDGDYLYYNRYVEDQNELQNAKTEEAKIALADVEFVYFGDNPRVIEPPVNPPTGINDVSNASNVYYANGTLNIESQEVIGNVSVYSLTGSVVETFTSNENAVSVGLNLQNGVYVVKFGTNSAKIVVQ